jgi:hypothetical protein
METLINTNILKEFDSLFVGFYDWLAGQYDHRTGGFYYARSSFDMEDFEPDIESAKMGLNIVERAGLLEDMPQAVREKMIRFFQNKQDPKDGFFYDKDPNMRHDEVMVMRAFGFAMGALRTLGAEPLYPLPDGIHTAPDYLATPETYLEWLKSVDLRNSWRGCDLLGTPNHHLLRMEESKRKPYIETAYRYFTSIQDPETGLWGGGNLYIRISGTFKLRSFFRAFRLPVPNVDRIYRSLLTCLRTEEAMDMCWVRNPMDLLNSFRGELDIPEQEREEFLRITCDNLRRFLKPDGGFSREVLHSPPAPNVAQVKEGEYYPYMPKAVPIGKGLVEGDMNAGTQALLIRNIAYRLFNLDPQPLNQYTGGFWDKVNWR